MHKRFILLLGLFVGSHVPARAQAPAPRLALAREPVAPIITILPASSVAWPSLLLSQDHGRSTAHFSIMFAGAYQRDYNLQHFSPLDEVKTLTLTRSSLPLVQLWGGRLHLDAFQSTARIPSAYFSSFDNGGMRGSRLPGQSYPGGPRSLHLSGLSLSFHFARDARTGYSARAWHQLPHILSTVLN
jgi:hypothetical protein